MAGGAATHKPVLVTSRPVHVRFSCTRGGFLPPPFSLYVFFVHFGCACTTASGCQQRPTMYTVHNKLLAQHLCLGDRLGDRLGSCGCPPDRPGVCYVAPDTGSLPVPPTQLMLPCVPPPRPTGPAACAHCAMQCNAVSCRPLHPSLALTKAASHLRPLLCPRTSSPQLTVVAGARAHVHVVPPVWRLPEVLALAPAPEGDYFCFLPSALPLDALSRSLLAYISAVKGFSYCRATR